jgi:hypothetical protein
LLLAAPALLLSTSHNFRLADSAQATDTTALLLWNADVVLARNLASEISAAKRCEMAKELTGAVADAQIALPREGLKRGNCLARTRGVLARRAALVATESLVGPPARSAAIATCVERRLVRVRGGAAVRARAAVAQRQRLAERRRVVVALRLDLVEVDARAVALRSGLPARVLLDHAHG